MKKKIEIEPPVFDARGYQINMHNLNGEPLPDPADLVVVKRGRGGHRPGAGRKPSGRQQIVLRLSPKTIAALHAARDAVPKGSLSDVAEAWLSAAFRSKRTGPSPRKAQRGALTVLSRGTPVV
jgi:hypothetical protein